MTERYTITDDGVTDNLSKKQYTKIKSGDNILDTISFTSLIQIVDLLNEQDQRIKELEQELFSIKVEKLDDRLAEYGGPDDEEVWQKEFGMSSTEAKKKAGWWV